ncbi:MAG: HAD family phosphatase [Erysipelotrichaceae bacterium]|nr:HAD family phosphatase [Erysipelotrichaceae bacterium]
MIKAILFDMDGILMDSEKHYMEGTIAWMRRLGYTGSKESVYRLIGTSMKTTYQMIYDMFEGKYTIEELKRANEDYFYREHVLQADLLMFDGVKEALEELVSLGLKLGLCSASPKHTIVRNLEAMNLTSYFDVVLCGDDFHESKPNPAIYLSAAKALRVEPYECIVYEDSELGIMAGVNANMFTVARIDQRYGQNQQHADLLVKDIQSLVTYIKHNVLHLYGH